MMLDIVKQIFDGVKYHEARHCEERQRRSNPDAALLAWIASLRSQ
jgi:hypothetical protein